MESKSNEKTLKDVYYKATQMGDVFHSLNFFKSFQKRFEREPTRGAL